MSQTMQVLIDFASIRNGTATNSTNGRRIVEVERIIGGGQRPNSDESGIPYLARGISGISQMEDNGGHGGGPDGEPDEEDDNYVNDRPNRDNYNREFALVNHNNILQGILL